MCFKNKTKIRSYFLGTLLCKNEKKKNKFKLVLARWFNLVLYRL